MLSKYKSGKYMFNILFILMIILITGSIVIAGGNDSHFVTISYFDDAMVFEGGVETNWSLSENEEALSGAEKMSMHSNHSVEFTFTGTKFRWIGSKAPGRGKADIYHNGELLASGVDLYSETTQNQAIIFSKEFDKGTHTIRIEPTGEKREEAIMALVSVDAFQYYPTLEKARLYLDNTIRQAKTMLIETGSWDFELGDNLETFHTEQAKDSFIKTIAEGLFVLRKDVEEPKEYLIAESDLNEAIEKFNNRERDPVFADLSSNENDAIVRGNPVWIEGKMGNAIALDGVNDYLEVPHSSSIDINEELTISLWVYRRSWTDHWNQLIGKGDNAYLIRRHGGNDYLTFTIRGSGDISEPTGGADLVTEEWVHVAGTFSNEDGVARLYMEGEIIAETEGDLVINSNEFPLAIGANKESPGSERRFFDGYIDEVQIYNRALTPEEIEEIKDKQLTGDEEGLVGYWNFSEIQ